MHIMHRIFSLVRRAAPLCRARPPLRGRTQAADDQRRLERTIAADFAIDCATPAAGRGASASVSAGALLHGHFRDLVMEIVVSWVDVPSEGACACAHARARVCACLCSCVCKTIDS